MLVFRQPPVEGADEADALLDAVQGVVRKVEPEVLGEEGVQGLEVLFVDALEDGLEEVGQGRGSLQGGAQGSLRAPDGLEIELKTRSKNDRLFHGRVDRVDVLDMEG
jgi:hypothetical protein